MAEVTLTATTGRELGTSASRRLRAEGFIPATVYGMGKEAQSVQVARGDFRKAMTTEAGVNALIKLSVDGDTEYALVKEIQRHTVRREVTHIDLLRIDPEVPMILDVPVVLTGEAKQVTAGGGMINQRLRNLRVTVRPDAIPTEIAVSITNLDVEQTLTVEDLNLPDGVTTDADPTTAVVSTPLTRAAIVAARQAKAAEAAGA